MLDLNHLDILNFIFIIVLTKSSMALNNLPLKNNLSTPLKNNLVVLPNKVIIFLSGPVNILYVFLNIFLNNLNVNLISSSNIPNIIIPQNNNFAKNPVPFLSLLISLNLLFSSLLKYSLFSFKIDSAATSCVYIDPFVVAA